MAAWTIERTDPNAFRVVFKDMSAGEVRWALLTSDHHFDNAHCDLGLLRTHLEWAKELDAPVFCFGDTFCAMQGKWDKRADVNELRPEFHKGNYLDALVDEAVKFYEPFASQIAMCSNGNHENSIMKRHQTDLTERLVSGLRQAGGPTLRGPYDGFVKFSFVKALNNPKSKPSTYGYTLYYNHGTGGGGEVTQGAISNYRTRNQYDADLFYSGHIHRQSFSNQMSTRLDRSGVIIHKPQLVMIGSSYKDDWEGGWHRENGMGARPKGGMWVKFTYMCDHGGGMVIPTPVVAGPVHP